MGSVKSARLTPEHGVAPAEQQSFQFPKADPLVYAAHYSQTFLGVFLTRHTPSAIVANLSLVRQLEAVLTCRLLQPRWLGGSWPTRAKLVFRETLLRIVQETSYPSIQSCRTGGQYEYENTLGNLSV